MTFSIASVTPDSLLSDGGHEIVVTGVFEEGHRYRVHLGDLGTIGDPACYSGIPGQANLVYPRSSVAGGILDTLTVYSPRVNYNLVTPYDITVIDYDTSEVHALSEVITALRNQFFTTVFSTRSLQPPYYKVGPRSLELEEPT